MKGSSEATAGERGTVQYLRQLEAVRIDSPGQVREAAIAFRDFAYSLFPCRIAAAHDIAVRQPMVDGDGANLATEIFGWSKEHKWLKTPYLALASPLPTACRFEAEPFWANADGFRTRAPNSWIQEIDISDFENRACARAVIVVPVHLPFGHIGAVSFNPVDQDQLDLSEEFDEYSDLLGLFARTFIASYQRIMVKPDRIPVGGSLLSKREVECLRWAAVGKTDQEIATIMDRSRATVRFHIQNAAMKLDAVNRSQTVFKASKLGYLGLNS